ncbi:MAG: RNA dependent RNA polymerase [Xiangshan Nyami-like virus]|uniref:RNA-directed RNA polymerase n=1 Tax=Xiangshan Nyami-like virus TaxID=2886229 RepID=A0A8K1YQN0_9MONO|nr:MAG: RNA dependent RNA polymerase [Xiangshan Nyami-like virus]UDL13960.1 MAG: RNA dependent RNA polymerase [Xiangshan Nyami-like virus]
MNKINTQPLVMEDLIEEEPTLLGRPVITPIFRKDRHLSSALLTTEIEYLLANRTNDRGLKREHKNLLEDLGEKEALDSSLFLGMGFKWLDLLASPKCTTQELTTCLHIATQALRISTLDYVNNESHVLASLTPFMVTCYQAKASFDSLLEKITFSTHFKEEWMLGKLKGCAYGNLHLVHFPEGIMIITHSHLVALRDCVNSWFSILLYTQIYNHKYPGIDAYKEAESIIKQGIELVITQGTLAYKLLKMWPSLTIACILRDLESRDDFFRTITDDLDCKDTALYKRLTGRICTTNRAMWELELSGICKCFGHPNIDMTASVNTWVKKGAAGKDIDKNTAQLIVGAFRLELCRQYYKDKKRWPVLSLQSGVPDKIVYCYKNNLWTETPTHPWRPEDFLRVVLDKNLDFDYHIDIADLLADKSIIPSREHWIHEYDKQAHRTQHGFFPRGPPPAPKSAIICYLQKERVTVKEVMDILESGSIPQSWLVMVAVAKEREFKYKDARFFGKMCFEMRLYQTATEKNIADSVFRYIKHQSMTMNEEQLIRTIIRMNAPITAQAGETYVFITLDFSSWCTNFRHEAATPLFIELDRLFGLHNIYSFTHLFPLNSVLLFQDRFAPPKQGESGDPLPGSRCYPYPEAWLEGLRQKGWTLLTILLILIASWRCGTSASLLGQGDNQVILLRIPPGDYLSRLQINKEGYIRQFLQVLEDLSTRIGIVIKLEETWWSSSLFEYSRRYHLNGAQVSGALKRVSRLASEANQVIPSLNSDLSGLFSTGASAAAEDSTPMYAYYCTIVEAAMRIRQSNPWLKEKQWETTCCLLLITRTLGGYPITIYSQFCTRAVQDVLTSNLHLVRTASKDPLLGKEMRKLVNLNIRGKRDYLSLIKDPQSLPLVLPVQPENFIKREIKKGLTDFVENVDVKDLFSLSTEMSQDNLIHDLMSISPCNPKLLNKIYALSNIGLQERWLGKFSNTRSIQQTAMKSWSSELTVISTVRQLEERFSCHLLNKKEDEEVIHLLEAQCVTVYAQGLRERAWGMPMEGITMPPQQEQVYLLPWETLNKEQAKRAILITEQKTPDLNMSHRRGEYTPYFGSSTKLRAKRSILQVVEVGSMISSMKQIMELISWVKGDEGMERLLTTMLSEKTTIDPDTLKMYTRQIYSGSLTHRLPCPALKSSGMSNQNLNHPSHFTITSDTALEYAKGGINYTICFQSVFLHSLSLLAHYTEQGVSYPRQMACLFSCSDCTWVIPAESFSLLSPTYAGILLPTRITELHQKDIHQRYPLTKQIGEEESYSVQMGRKFAAWIVKRRMIDKITSLENRALEESMTVSFVNLAEFSRLQVPLFLKSFIFYCAVFDSHFFFNVYEHFVEILEGGTKNPYDIMLDSLKRCNHLRTLVGLQGGAKKCTYSATDMRILLFSIITKYLDDLPDLLASAYIVTPEDDLSHVIKAVKVWLSVNAIPDFLLVTMSKEEFDASLAANYSQYKQILPAITLPEEETIALVRSRPVVSSFKEESRVAAAHLPVPIASPTPCIPRPFTPYLYYMQNDPLATSLREAMTAVGPQLDYNIVVTLDDKDGVLYSVIAHSTLVVGGYPHWPHNDHPHTEPVAIVADSCPIKWDKEDYYLNAVKNKIDVPNYVLLVIPDENTTTLYDLPEGWQILRRITTSGDYDMVISIHRSVVKVDPEECWILQGESLFSRTRHVDVRDTSRLGEVAKSTLESIQDYLIRTISDPPCINAFPHVVTLLGLIPRTLDELMFQLRYKIRQQVSLITSRSIKASHSYEHAVALDKREQRVTRAWKVITKCHGIVGLIRKRNWSATAIKGYISYHVHNKKRICWRNCGEGYVVNMEDVGEFQRGGLMYWNRYVWLLYQMREERDPPSFSLSCPPFSLF